ncbi:diguanylate cyclase [Ideonella sp.]|uniref:GGDEF domain-containing protein n=1 Tax=Ideonella sp. TaxID=1929293 RepID=UPI003BB65EF3
MAGVLLPEVRRAAAHWLAFCVLSAGALWLILLRDELPPALGIGLSNLALVAAMVAVQRGAEFFFRLPSRDREHFLVLAAMLVVLAVFGTGTDGNPVRVPFLTALLGAMILRTVVRVHQPMQAEFGVRVARAVHLPALMVAVASLLRSAWVFTQPADAVNFDVQMRDGPQLGLAMFAALAGVHFAYAGMLVARLSRRLVHLSRHDALTGLLNRRAMFEQLDQEWHRWRRHQSTFQVLMLDIDWFKQVNDVHGHAAGDRALVAVAECLRSTLRPTDLAARIGGEEFLVLLPSADAEAACVVAERLRAQIAAQVLVSQRGSFAVTVSIGLSAVAASDPAPESVLERADQALYAAKAGGRDQVSLADGAQVQGRRTEMQ